MKRITIWSIAVLLVVVVGVVVATADVHERYGFYGHRWGPFGPMGYVAHELKLSHGQKDQIHTIWETERPIVFEMVHEFAAQSKEMDEATAKGNLDETKVQEIAARQGDTVAKLLVEKEHFKQKIYSTVLTPEQRTKADELQSHWHERMDLMSKSQMR
jgi:Spy/CpxP family protein refolding chaperone